MKKITYIVCLLFICSLTAKACMCIFTETFCKSSYALGWAVQLHPELANTRLITKGRILSHLYHGVQVEILDVIIGNESRDTINIWGDWDGSSCRLHTNVLEDNDTLIFAIGNGESPYSLDSIENANDYKISSCGIYYLHYSNGQVEGFITQSQVWEYMPYEEFKAMVPNCYATAIEEVGLSSNLAYPNPFSQQLFVPNSQSVRIFDVLGSLVFSGASTPNQAINLSHLPQGIYYIESTQIGSKTLKMQKVVKM